MNVAFTREGLREMRGAYVTAALAVVASVTLVLASQWYYEKERRDNATAARRLQEARSRLDGARRERDSLQQSSDVFRTLVDRGLLQSERRLDLVELVNGLRTRHQLASLDYEISPQRPLALAGGRVFPSVDVLASRVKIKLRALHEGDVMGFIDDLSRTPQGFYSVDRCAMRRLETTGAESLAPHVEADCAFEWITLKEKHAGRGA